MLIDGEDYFSAVRSALEQARRSVLVLGWDFDPRTVLAPSASPSASVDARLGNLLQRLTLSRPELEVLILVWDMALPISALHQGYPQRARTWFEGRVRFQLDGEHPPGGCHHQKVVVVDDEIAFCGGTDLACDRWDSQEHLDDEPRRRLPSGKPHPPRHDVMMLVSGAAAAALGDLVRARWLRATGEILPPASPRQGREPQIWPADVPVRFRDAQVAIARTEPHWGVQEEVRESLTLYLDAIRAARNCVYLENQYVTSPQIGSVLAERLKEPDGPEIVIVCPTSSPSYFDRLAIDEAQRALLAALVRADRHHKLRVYTPVTTRGRSIIVHSKLSLIDDRLLRVGSTNLNNRSLGFDTECDLAIDAFLHQDASRRESAREDLRAIRAAILAHHARAEATTVAGLIEEHGSVVRALDALASPSLRQLRAPDLEPQPRASWIANMHLGDPESALDAWRPWKRQPGPTLAARDESAEGTT